MHQNYRQARPRTPRPRARGAGYTLVELMVSLVILGIMSLGILNGMLQARRLTEGSIYLGTATTVAQGYIEQMKNMDYRLLDKTTIPDFMSQGHLDSLVVSPFPVDPEVGNPDTDVPNSRALDINNTPENATDDLVIDYVVYIEDITDENNGIGNARRIVLRWSYLSNSPSGPHRFQNTLYAIRSKVPTF